MDSCPGDLILTACATGKAPSEDQQRVAAHIAGCADCRSVLAAFVVAGDEADGEANAGPDADEVARVLDADARYEQTRDTPLGSGGRGAVYAAFDRELQRPVAIKVLWGSRGIGAAARGQLLTEARALGRVTHPNIVAVYDIHEWRETTVLVMEHVSGADLRTWAMAQARSSAEVAGVFAQVARGLGAAHDAGVVHCDVKPENILVGEDGRVRLTDFGLARHLAQATADRPGIPALATGSWNHTGLGGTPAYIAPELLAGDRPSPASDQFSFAVTLYECLHMVRPFPGTTVIEVLEAIRDGRRAAAPPRRLPSRLRDVIERCLSHGPDRRYPTMQPIAEALDRLAAPRRHRTKVVALVLGLAAAAAVIAPTLGRQPSIADGCPAALADATWAPSAQTRLAARFSSGSRDDGYLHARLHAAFDAYAERWRAARGACPRAAAAETRSRIATCLTRGTGQMRALLGLISTPDPAGGPPAATRDRRDRAVFAVSSLPDPKRCIDEPDRAAFADPSVPADDVERVVRAQAETDLGAYAASAVTAMEVANRLPADSHPGLRAEALMIAGTARGRLDQPAEAERLMLAAVDAATRARDDDLVARAFTNLLSNTAMTKPRQAGQTLELAEAAVARAGNTPRLESALLIARARIERQTDQLPLAVEHLTRAVALRESLTGPDDLDVAIPVGNLANATAGIGRMAEALALQNRALKILEHHLPENHPELARLAHNVGSVALGLGRMSEAEAAMRRGLAIREAIFGPEHTKVAESLEGLSEVLRQTGRAAEALPLAERALAVRQRTLPATHVWVAYSHANLAAVLIELERCAAALPHLQSAIDRFAAAESPLEFMAPAALARARCQCRDGAAAEGRTAALAMLERIERTPGTQHQLTADALLEIGLCDLARRDASQAEPSLRRAVSILEHAGVEANRIAEVRWPLARALWQLGRPEEALAAARESQRAYRTIGHPIADQIERWLADPRRSIAAP
jgi:tetratricopeptide (TPR) repeat protein